MGNKVKVFKNDLLTNQTDTMSKYKQVIAQLEKRKGGYYYIVVPAKTANQFSNKHKTRLVCTLDKHLRLQCGLNHLGDGNFFIIISTRNLKQLNKKTGEEILVQLEEDPNPLGVEMPEVLNALLEQDDELKNKFEQFTMGKKRSVIHAVSRIKDIDKQVSTAIAAINGQLLQRKKKTL